MLLATSLLPLFLLHYAAAIDRVHLVGITPGHHGSHLMGTYESHGFVNERPAFVRVGGASSLWNAAGTWFVGRSEMLGQVTNHQP